MGKTAIFLVLLPVIIYVSTCEAQFLKQNFYKKTCPQAEKLVRDLVWAKVENNTGLPAKLLRLHFHDCFLRGCDASILLDDMNGITAEKHAPSSLTLGGFEIIDYVKAELEKVCPGVVSCSDVLALAARDSVSYQFKEPKWNVLTGRRDGNISRADEVVANLPSGNDNYTTLIKAFLKKGLYVRDLVVLSGAHTIGVAPCVAIKDRLTGKGDVDPSLEPNYANFLRAKCPNFFAQVEFDQGSPNAFDTHYYSNLIAHKGLLASDSSLITNRRAANFVKQLQDPKFFYTEFAKSMEKMGAIEVLVGTSGNIRKKCNVLIIKKDNNI